MYSVTSGRLSVFTYLEYEGRIESVSGECEGTPNVDALQGAKRSSVFIWLNRPKVTR